MITGCPGSFTLALSVVSRRAVILGGNGLGLCGDDYFMARPVLRVSSSAMEHLLKSWPLPA
jgi:hypothetical protein